MHWLSRLAKGVAVAVLAALGHATLLNAEDPAPLAVMFINEHPAQAVELYWEDHAYDHDHPDGRRFEALVPPRGGSHLSKTYAGHEFSYDIDGKRHFTILSANDGNADKEQYIILAGDDSTSYQVRCEITSFSQKSVESIDISVKPYWSPRGAAHFLELVRARYYNGVAFHRVVPGFVAQFGIAKDYDDRTKRRKQTISDDLQQGQKFHPGMLYFAGSGPDSRSTEIVVVLPKTRKALMDKFGENSWEVPFAQIDGDINKSAVKNIYAGYGNKGPDSTKIYEADGYTNYLPKKFPKLDYINSCYIIDEIGLTNDQFGQEF